MSEEFDPIEYEETKMYNERITSQKSRWSFVLSRKARREFDRIDWSKKGGKCRRK